MPKVTQLRPAERRRAFVTLIHHVDGTFTVRRTMPDGSRHLKGDEHFGRDRRLATWCAETASRILGVPLLHMRGGQHDC